VVPGGLDLQKHLGGQAGVTATHLKALILIHTQVKHKMVPAAGLAAPQLAAPPAACSRLLGQGRPEVA